MGTDNVPERRDFLKAGTRRREEWSDEGRAGAAKLSPTRVPSRLAGPLFSRAQPQQQQEMEGPPSPSDPAHHAGQQTGHLYVLHPAINNLSFSTGQPPSRCKQTAAMIK